jgi:UDP-N-acetylglucosamine 4,6-dehydratase
MNWTDKTILITGLTGSFGSAFTKYLLTKNPKKLICFSRDWLKQKNLRDELGNPQNMRWFIGDVRDKDRLLKALKGVDILIHAAAIKCLPTCQYNPFEAMQTNVIGTQNVIDACIERGVHKCLLVSTDKAVAPANTYGATKALAEHLWLNANMTAASDDIRFSVCRYGNVCGSSGSVVPIFKKLIAEGAEYLPITDERMTRFWMEMDKVLHFVEDSIESMEGNELFIPRLPSVLITDLCKALDMPYKVIGIRDGEKLHESLDIDYSSDNNTFLTVDEIKQTIEAIR